MARAGLEWSNCRRRDPRPVWAMRCDQLLRGGLSAMIRQLGSLIRTSLSGRLGLRPRENIVAHVHSLRWPCCERTNEAVHSKASSRVTTERPYAAKSGSSRRDLKREWLAPHERAMLLVPRRAVSIF